ncbi:hypothetical protein BH09BAC6_BH09BAC6_21870 [soil metagenome]|jgi:hypothetical protein
MTSVNHVFSQFMTADCENIIVANETIEGIDLVLTGEEDNLAYSSDSLVTVDIDISVVKFYGDPYHDMTIPDFTIPTQDFRVIVVAWADFLRLNNSKKATSRLPQFAMRFFYSFFKIFFR